MGKIFFERVGVAFVDQQLVGAENNVRGSDDFSQFLKKLRREADWFFRAHVVSVVQSRCRCRGVPLFSRA